MTQPEYPLYIVSKGRWDHGLRLTSRALEEMGVAYRIVVEAQEYDQYAAVLDPSLATILVLDPTYQRDYDVFGETPGVTSKGSGPARNFVWDHAVSEGHARHWIMDDNIQVFLRLVRNRKVSVLSGMFFRYMEDFVGRYQNIAMAGPNYKMFAPRKSPDIPPFYLNTRIYSCNLIRTDLPFRWRGRYNEDTDLSLRMLKAGWCTVLFNAFLQDKRQTCEKRGGNTDSIYTVGTLEKSRMIVDMHPDVAKLSWRFGRWHHHVDYRRFKRNHLKRRPDAVIPEGVNEYGMTLVRIGAD